MDFRSLPLSALRAFEAAARHHSLTRAGEELGVTPGAIRHQLNSLEGWLGGPLLVRHGQRLLPTPGGERLQVVVHAGFQQLLTTLVTLRAECRADHLHVAADLSFAARWLVPRLDRFRDKAPEVDVQIGGPLPTAHYPVAGVDVAITYQPEAVADFRQVALPAETLLPLASPTLLTTGAVDTVAGLLDLPLLHIDRAMQDAVFPAWDSWFRRRGLDPGALRGARFSLALMAIQAARDGHGVVLVGNTLAMEELAQGSLIPAFHDPTPDTLTRHVLYRQHGPRAAMARRFSDWLLAEATDQSPGSRCHDAE